MTRGNLHSINIETTPFLLSSCLRYLHRPGEQNPPTKPTLLSLIKKLDASIFSSRTLLENKAIKVPTWRRISKLLSTCVLRNVCYKFNFNCCFTVHFDKFKAFLPTSALFIKTQNATAST
jgi:hypothetical protein